MQDMSQDVPDVDDNWGEDLDKLVEIALLDLDTLNEYSIQTNPERVERPRVAIKRLHTQLGYARHGYESTIATLRQVIYQMANQLQAHHPEWEPVEIWLPRLIDRVQSNVGAGKEKPL